MKAPPNNLHRKLPKEHRKVSVLRLTDPLAVGDSIEVLNMDVINLNPESFEYRHTSVPLDECCLIYQTTNTAMRTHSTVHADFESCWILGPQAHGSLDGKELRPYSMIAAGPNAHGELFIDDGYENVGWLVPPDVLEQHLQLRGKTGAFAIPEGHEVWYPARQETQELFELGARIAAAAENSPEIFNDNHWARYGAQVEFMDALFAAIESCDPSESADSDKKSRSYSQIVRACEDYTENLDGRRPYLSELCATAGVSERTLQNAFRDIMGMSPLTFLQRLRLHRARDDLRKAKSGSTTVTDVAMNWGFWHFSDFSKAYRNCFDELPSETLKRDSQNK